MLSVFMQSCLGCEVASENMVQSRLAETRFAETRFAETPTLTLTLNPNFGELGFGESGFGESRSYQPLTLISANRVSAKTGRHREYIGSTYIFSGSFKECLHS